MPVALQEHSDALVLILQIIEQLSHIQDLDALLDRILLEARRLTRADAGTIFLAEDKLLRFGYVQNDTLFPSQNNKHIYTDSVIKINLDSITGYVAQTGEPIILDDAYVIPPLFPFAFNRSFDRLSGYRTRSIIAVPMKTSQNKVVGVLELLNALDHEDKPATFSRRDRLVLAYFANRAAGAIERAMMNREMILRMVKMCQMRDPTETGAHANRVAAYTAEIYHKWAADRGVGAEEIKKLKGHLRMAGMLHDLGKVAVSDTILKNPGRLTPEEYETMKHHTVHGARFFENSFSELDVISAQVALNHHERWDGTGYPGKIAYAGAKLILGPGKRREEIPLFGRIVALADVYDALVSKRTYKESLPEDQVLEIIQAESGKQFDPEIVKTFLAIYDVITAIRNKYT